MRSTEGQHQRRSSWAVVGIRRLKGWNEVGLCEKKGCSALVSALSESEALWLSQAPKSDSKVFSGVYETYHASVGHHICLHPSPFSRARRLARAPWLCFLRVVVCTVLGPSSSLLDSATA